MDVDQTVQRRSLPFVPGGLYSLLIAAIVGPAAVISPVQKAVFDLLELYFCDKEVYSILIQGRNSKLYLSCDWENEWIPLSFLCSLKSLRSLRASPPDVLRVISCTCPAAFAVSPDGECIRRMISFEQLPLTLRADWSYRAQLRNLLIEATGFADDITFTEIEAYFRNFTGVTGVSRENGPNGTRVVLVSCPNPDFLVKLLAHNHRYEESPIQLTVKVVPLESKSVQGVVHGLVPTPVDSAATLIGAKGHAKLDGAKIFGYSRNRLVGFGPIGSECPVSILGIKAAFDAFAPVHSIYMRRNDEVGHVKFKSSVATEVASIIAKQGGIDLGGEMFPVHALQGESERLFYDLQRELGDSAGPSLSATALAASAASAAKKGRTLQRQKKRKPKRKAATILARLGKDEFVKKGDGRKRSRKADDEGEEDGAGGHGEEEGATRERKILAVLSRKKAKVDDLTLLLEGL
ncbi:hypothetical protein DFJ73DRAFT_851078 [Zopfochytrium polystomum]|nr:hypothetical protein DFJ73DRAFT_851078 [Zopfochytrium polystomum]